MPIDSINSAKSGRTGAYLRNTLFVLLGVGTAGGVGGYFQLKDEINGKNTQLTQKLNESETARASMAEELAKANATIARLEQGMSLNKSAIEGNATAIDEYRKALANMGSEAQVQNKKIESLVKRDGEHDKGLANLNKSLDTVTIKVGNLETKVSVSDLQDVYNKALSSTVIVNMEVKYKKDDGMGTVVEKTETHQGSGVVAAHINGGKDGGYIVTNWHVLNCEHLKDEDYKNKEITLTFPDGNKVKAKPHYYLDSSGKEQLARKKDHDLVLLKTTENISKAVPVSFASDEPKAGEAVFVVGNPFGDVLGNRFSGSFGIISGDSIVKYGSGSPTILSKDEKDAIKTTRTDAAMNPGNSGGLGWRVRDGKMVFMPTFIFPGEIFHGMGFGVTAPTISGDIKTWIPYDLNSHGGFVERESKPAKPAPVKTSKITPQNKNTRTWQKGYTPLVRQSELRSYNTAVLAGRRFT